MSDDRAHAAAQAAQHAAAAAHHAALAAQCAAVAAGAPQGTGSGGPSYQAPHQPHYGQPYSGYPQAHAMTIPTWW